MDRGPIRVERSRAGRICCARYSPSITMKSLVIRRWRDRLAEGSSVGVVDVPPRSGADRHVPRRLVVVVLALMIAPTALAACSAGPDRAHAASAAATAAASSTAPTGPPTARTSPRG